MSSSVNDCRVLVVQNGARHNYAVPAALAKHDMLAGFYTDACGNEGVGKVISLLASLPIIGKRFSLLKKRQVPISVLPLTRSFPFSTEVDELLARFSGTFTQGRLLGISMRCYGVRDANLIYSSFGWSPLFLAYARSCGPHIVTEFYIKPSYWRLHREECRLFPEWEQEPVYILNGDNPTERLRRNVCSLTGDIIVPTQSVKDDVVTEKLFSADKIHVVPYGIGDAFFDVINSPKPGKVLYVGSCTLMKGIHYLAKAAQQLMETSDDERVTITAAGDVSEVIRNKSECAYIHFLSRVPRNEVLRLYEETDVLVFPTLSDSFGAVVLEAMAAGIPVICSPYCADIVEHGISGFVIEPRDTTALASAMQTLTQDRELRQKMSIAARDRALQYTNKHYASRLVSTLKSIDEKNKQGPLAKMPVTKDQAVCGEEQV